MIITLKSISGRALDVENSLNNWFKKFPCHLFKSITFDCGKEFSNWKSISNLNDIDIYFTDLGTPSQRGLDDYCQIFKQLKYQITFDLKENRSRKEIAECHSVSDKYC